MRTFFLTVILGASIHTGAQPPQVPLYSINNIPLPEAMNKQVCISGMKFMDNKLWFASERCPIIYAADPASGQIVNSVSIRVPQEFEMEGMTSCQGKLYLVSENTAAVYEVDAVTGDLRVVSTSIPLPPKSKNGDGMEGVAANESHNKFYLLRERNEERTQAEIYTFSINRDEKGSLSLTYESMISLPLENPQWRYSDICFDNENKRLLLLKSYSKGKLRQQYLETIETDAEGNIASSRLQNIPVDRFSDISNHYKDQDYSMNLEGITIDDSGNIYIVSDNTSGKAQCDLPAREKTILLELRKN
jgi:uncharacterized protein YjiK